MDKTPSKRESHQEYKGTIHVPPTYFFTGRVFCMTVAEEDNEKQTKRIDSGKEGSNHASQPEPESYSLQFKRTEQNFILAEVT